MLNRAVAVVGMCGSGKSEIAQLFLDANWQKVYFGGVTVSQLKKRNIAVNEQNEREMREQLRKQHGMHAFALLLCDEIEDKLQISNTVLDGLYSWSEYKFLKQKLNDRLVVLAVVTNNSIRKQRLEHRDFRSLSHSEVDARDTAEIENLEKGGPIAIADYYIVNNGDMQCLHNQVQQFLQWLEN